MRSCWFGAALVAVSTAAVALAANPLPAHAPLAAPRPALAAEPTPGAGGVLVARYAFNGRAGSIIDESGRGHTLTVISGHGGAVRRVAHGPGSALAFPPRCTARVCPHVALQTGSSSADLNPGTRNIAF